MDVVYTFGRSVNVDGDEWIDLGPIPTVCDGEATAAPPTATESNAYLEPVAEPEPEQKLQQQTPENKPGEESAVKGGKVTGTSRLSARAPVREALSKAARSKEALMAFYLSRAKQMEAKHKKIVVPPTQPVVIRSLQESEHSVRTGIGI
ncbi:hypothetical protein PC116_g22797 [Phytophthora cactorum]|uniref:Uncharacterized protein n=1 Tax=Phytophthora cactorum TaxID=29920 RepID=A0A8T1FFQ6_9STRA|nr:hypothetical protein PC112_g18963 [Phytophthora cactorum]KAG2805141.1 hypothetical protein PC111_g17956 [Phytophthora cactorum]KAG2842120.1 hypothetical protein PC113_g18884 [Phytophthora cactorum]KAG2883431.1 hypothetical protein PC114_g20596 [Phytophthora cactorum]KAG2893911.1 hypothetical protein PC115_g18304 [Phytophthora cactorum]